MSGLAVLPSRALERRPIGADASLLKQWGQQPAVFGPYFIEVRVDHHRSTPFQYIRN